MLFLLFAIYACVPFQKMKQVSSGNLAVGLSVADEKPLTDDEIYDEIVIDSIRETLSEGPIIMNAIKDAQTGEMVATDVINASRVTARFRNVAERGGWVSLSFDVSVPAAMSDSRWKLKICPIMSVQDDTIQLEPIFITGKDYRAAQLRGYERYNAFVASIVTDTADFVRMRQLEVFLQRHYPQAYAMKADSSIVPEPMMENVFGVTQDQVLEHYRKHLLIRVNRRKMDRIGDVYHKYVKDPIVSQGVRLDTVLIGDGGDFTYRYVHTFKSRPRLKKVGITLSGSLYEKGEERIALNFPQELTFYISSLSTLADDRPRYMHLVVERVVYDNTKALIDFRQGQADIDTLLGDNASELTRIRRCIDDVVSRKNLVLDSLVVVASCSPEGEYHMNRRLSIARSKAVLDYIQEYVPEGWQGRLLTSQQPENWQQLEKLIASDSIICSSSKTVMMNIINNVQQPDSREEQLAVMKEYRYLRESLYPQLRSVAFDFYLHRAGMVKDTIHTSQLDTIYMSGVRALHELDYKKAVELLRPYGDFNSALALMSADYNHSALEVLDRIGVIDARTCYLKAMILSRLGLPEEAVKYFKLAVAYEPHMEHRANLDPEMHALINIYKQL